MKSCPVIYRRRSRFGNKMWITFEMFAADRGYPPPKHAKKHFSEGNLKNYAYRKIKICTFISLTH
jgi:hypothetical protein